jgi:hypothetical protein
LLDNGRHVLRIDFKNNIMDGISLLSKSIS